MANIIKDGIAWQSGQLREYASEIVTYARGYDAVDVPAVFGQKLLKLDDGQGGFIIEWTDLDFLIASKDLVFGDEPITPKRGDIIWISVGYDSEAYEVFPFGASDPAWRWSDPFQTRMRIHTKHIDCQQFTS